MFIKATKISHLTDARFFAAHPLVEWITYNVPDIQALSSSKEINAWITGMKKSADMHKMELSNVYQAYSELRLDAVDMGSADYRKYKDELDIPVLLRVHYTPDLSYRYYIGQEEKIKYIILEIDDMESVDYLKLQKLCESYPTIISTKLSDEILIEIIKLIKPAGIELEGSAEEGTGLKNFDYYQNIFDTIENMEGQ